LASDLGPSETVAARVAVVVVVYVIGCGLIGALLPRQWYVAVISAWGPVLISTFMLVALVFRLGEPAGAPGAFAGFWLLALIVFPAFAFASGYVGAWLRRRMGGREEADPAA
jgi:hypothetical protein